MSDDFDTLVREARTALQRRETLTTRQMDVLLDATAGRSLQDSDKFFIGDRVQVVLEGTLMGFNRDDGHYYMVGHAGDHVPWLYTLHWSTPFRVLTPGPRDLGDGATTAEEAWEASQS